MAAVSGRLSEVTESMHHPSSTYNLKNLSTSKKKVRASHILIISAPCGFMKVARSLGGRYFMILAVFDMSSDYLDHFHDCVKEKSDEGSMWITLRRLK
jgi:hypothetical protein